ncbi:EAL domain-containing protein [Massilia sp. PAMC28688]|uniref:sensor domain-containing protein n=1 Tax=Massilia sp. PAMC28688 TaxID=2861283 RepID=UPI001C636539|nr:EAL domain-containing protein [Massilia sp. PAMC28688]QYF93447.1 EAL domain-containing protein [Massilia sp. PAMC28688]
MAYSDVSSFTFIASASGIILTWPPPCEAATGIRAADATGHPVRALFEPHDTAPDMQAATEGTVAARVAVAGKAPLRVALEACVHPLAPAPITVYVATPLSEHGEEDAFAAIVERLPCIFYVIDPAGTLQYWNARLASALQRDACTLFGAPVFEFFDKDERAGVAASMARALNCGEATHSATLVGRRGARTPFLFHCARLELGGQPRIVGTGVDLSERTRESVRLHVYERAMHASVNAIIITRCEQGDHLIDYVNPAFERLTGYPAAEVVNRNPRFMRAGTLDSDERRRIRDALAAGTSVHSVLRNRRRDGAIFWNDLRIGPVLGSDGKPTHFIAIIDDITESKTYEERLRHLATHDSMTGLANRAMLHDRLDVAVGRARRSGACVALAYVDLDNFKYINDTFGHQGGDIVLKAIATRLGSAVREGDTVARVGGDEFVVVINDCASSEHVAEFVQRMRRDLSEPLQLPAGHVHPTVSIGVSLFPNDADTCAALLRAADAAMYVAKAGGKNRYQFYSAEIDEAAHRYLDMEAHLRRGIAAGELTLRFQPKVDLASGQMVGAEALVRWNHPARGEMQPDSFITFAEECGLIVQLGEWVLRESCSTLRDIRAAGYTDFTLSVNLSARQLNQNGFADTVASILGESLLGQGKLELEVTESQLMHNPEEAARTLAHLKALGVKLSIDDFGTGYSSLSYLQKFPLDYIKIDRSFLAGIRTSHDSAVIAQAIIALGHSLHMRVIAEGVETEGQLDFLRRHHCDQIQGFYFSPPVARHTLMDYLACKRSLSQCMDAHPAH